MIKNVRFALSFLLECFKELFVNRMPFVERLKTRYDRPTSVVGCSTRVQAVPHSTVLYDV